MNRQIVKLFAFIVVLFAVLVGFTSYWSVFDAQALKEKDANARPLLEQQQIRRGRIVAADGTVIARSVAKGHGNGLRYVRRYPEGSLFGHPIGYSFVRQGDSEFEQFHNDELIGEESEFSSILDELTGHRQEGNDVVTNLDPEATRVAIAGLQQVGFGAVVAIEPVERPGPGAGLEPALRPEPGPRTPRRTEQRPDLAAVQPRDPGPVPAGLDLQGGHRRGRARQRRDHPGNDDQRPGIARRPGPAARQRLQPGLGLDLARHRADELGQHLVRPARRRGRPETLFEYMEAFGFGSKPAIDLPSDQLSTSGVFAKKQLLGRNDPVDIARIAIGQERLR